MSSGANGNGVVILLPLCASCSDVTIEYSVRLASDIAVGSSVSVSATAKWASNVQPFAGRIDETDAVAAVEIDKPSLYVGVLPMSNTPRRTYDTHCPYVFSVGLLWFRI